MTKSTELFQLKYSKKVVDFITDKIEGGMTLAAVCNTYGPPASNLVPNEKNCYRWMKKYPDFKKAIGEAYKTLLMRLIDEKLELARRAQDLATIVNSTASDTEDEASLSDQIKKARFELDAIKVKQRALEFTLTRIAPKFVEDLKDSANTSIASLPPITIVNFSTKSMAANRTIEAHEQRPLLDDKATK